MKPISYNRFRSLASIGSAFSVAFFIHFAASSASAANRFWSANGTTASGNGTWNTSTVNRWGTAAAGPYTLAWVNGVDVAILGSTAASTLTLGENITCGGITAQANNSGSGSINESASLFTLTLGITGNNVFSGFQSTTAGRPLSINAVIVGTSGANVVLTGPSSTPTQVTAMSLNRANTFVGTTSFSGSSSGAVNLTLGNQLALQNSTLTLSAACKTLIFNDTVAANAFTFGGLTAATAGAGRDLALQNDATIPAAIALSVGKNDADTSYAGVLSGPGSLLKIGNGTLSLSANNTYTGTTTVSAGKLQGVVGGDCASSIVTIDNTLGTLGISVTDNTKTWTCAGLASTAVGEIAFSFGSVTPSTTVSPLTITVLPGLTGSANFSATPKVRVNTDTGLIPGTYPLMTWDTVSGIIPSDADLIDPPLLPQTDASLSVSGNTLNLVITSTALTVEKANNSNNLNLGSSWVGGTAPDGTKQAIWNNTVTTANTTVLAADATWAGISILNPNGLVTINGSSTLTLGNAAIDIDLSTANTADLNLNCPFVLGADNIWNIAATRTATLGGQISGAFPITKQGDGTVVLSSAANNYSSATTVAAGTLQLGASNVIPDGATAANVSLDGTLDLSGNSEIINGLSGAGIIDNTAIASSTLTVGGNNQTSTFSGLIQDTSGTLNLNKIGSGTLALGGANTLSGAVTISGGVLSANNNAPLNNVTGISMADGTRLRTNANNASINAPITLGALGTTATISASTFDGTGTTLVPFTIGGAISGVGNLTLSGIESTNSYGLIILNAASNYTGSTLITCSDEIATPSQVGNNNILVRLGTPNALPTTTVLTLDGGDGAPLASAPGRFCELNLNGNNQTLAGLTNVTGRTLRVQRVCDRRVTGLSSMLTINNATDFEYTGFLGSSSTAGFSNFGVTKDGAGKQTFSGTIGYSGATIVNQGILSLGVLNQGTVNNNASTVTIANTGAFLNLTFVGSDTVDKLFIGAIQKDAGVYGRVGSGAQFEISQITGDGTLTVSSNPGFSSWITETFANGTVPGGQQGANQDFDNDGISNLVEYAVAGQDPTVPNASVGTFAANVLSFTKRVGTSGLTYAIQDSTDLGVSDTWATVTGGSYVNNATTISFTLTPGSPVRNFVRLQVLSN